MKQQIRKSLFLAISMLGLSLSSRAQCDWHYSTFGGASEDGVHALTGDASGNIYITGYFSTSISFGSITLNSEGGEDIFLAKIDPDGNAIWAVEAGSVLDDEATGIGIDNSGNVYIAGTFDGDVSFGAIDIANQGGSDLFLAKYNASGSLQWVTSASSSGSETVEGVDVANGMVYLTGRQAGATFYNASAGSNTLASNPSNYIAIYDGNGTIQGLDHLATSGTIWTEDLIADGNGDVYVTGGFNGSVTIGAETHNPNGSNDIILVKYDGTTLAPIWTKSAGSSDTDEGTHLAVDGSDNIYLSGEFQGTISFDGQTASTSGSSDVFLAKFNSSGSTQFLTRTGTSSCCENSRGLYYDQGNNLLYMTAYIQGNNFLYGSLPVTQAEWGGVFLFEIQSSGALNDVVHVPSGNTGIWPPENHLFVTSLSDIIIAHTTGDVWFNGETITTNNSSDDIFIFHLQDLSNLLFLSDPSLCIVAVDPTSKKNIIYWDDEQDAAVEEYNIYKEDILGDLELIHTEVAGGGGSYIDLNSEPKERAAYYVISAVDACDNETDYDNYGGITTMHLILYQGPNNTWSLHWSPYFDDDDDDAVLYYRILRGTEENNLVAYDSIQSGLTNTYTDLNPPGGDVYYVVEAVVDQDCAPSGVNPGSNKVANTELSVSLDEPYTLGGLKTFPNPTEGPLTIDLSDSESGLLHVAIINALGQKIQSLEMEGGAQTIDLTSNKKGIYTILATMENGKQISQLVTLK